MKNRIKSGSFELIAQGSPTWCPQALGRPQAPSRSPVGIGIAKGSWPSKFLAFLVVLCFERRCP